MTTTNFGLTCHIKYKRNYFNYLMECLSGYDEYTGTRPKDILEYIFKRFYSEYSYNIERSGKHRAMTDWLQGLALPIPFYNDEIIQLAKNMGSIRKNASERTQEKVIENYFSFFANLILSWEPRYNIIRYHKDNDNQIVKRNLSITEAQRHCKDPDTRGDNWFDGYEYNTKTRKLFTRYGVTL